jgi:hypothetical protein
MTQTNPPLDRPLSFWRKHALSVGVMIASLTPLATNGGCAPAAQCPAGQTLTALGCEVVAPVDQCPGQTLCGASCVTVTSDAANCGACGTVCDAATPFCSQSMCSASCGVGLTTCGTSCSNLQTSQTDCGTCGNVCGNSAVCQAGTCVQTQTGVGGTGNVGVGGSGVVGAGGSDVVGAGGGVVGAGGGVVGAGGGVVGAGGGTGEPIGGYHVHGDWAGFAFTFTEEAKLSTITETPVFQTMLDEDGPYCVSGTVPTSEDYSNIAAFGVNVNQPKIDDAPVGTVASAGDGIVVDVVVNSGTEILRVQLEDGTDPADPDAENHRWCAGISGTGTHPLPWSEFTTKCWCALDSTDEACAGNTVFDGRAIAKVIVYVPEEGPDGDAANFDFCINDIGPTNITSRGTGEIVASCGNTSGLSGTISDQYGTSTNGTYAFQANGWGWGGAGGGSHSFTLKSGVGFAMTSQTCNSGNSSPCSFPSVYIGTPAGSNPRTSGNGLPAQISSITSIPTCLGWSSGGTPASDEYNVSYDVWFNSNAGANYAEKFLMVWFRDPPSFQPGGMTPVATSVIGDQSWSIWFGPNADGQDVVSFVAPNKRADGQAYSFDLKDFIDEAVARGYLSETLHLTAVMAGMEVWGGGQGASIDGFRAVVE